MGTGSPKVDAATSDLGARAAIARGVRKVPARWAFGGAAALALFVISAWLALSTWQEATLDPHSEALRWLAAADEPAKYFHHGSTVTFEALEDGTIKEVTVGTHVAAAAAVATAATYLGPKRANFWSLFRHPSHPVPDHASHHASLHVVAGHRGGPSPISHEDKSTGEAEGKVVLDDGSLRDEESSPPSSDEDSEGSLGDVDSSSAAILSRISDTRVCRAHRQDPVIRTPLSPKCRCPVVPGKYSSCEDIDRPAVTYVVDSPGSVDMLKALVARIDALPQATEIVVRNSRFSHKAATGALRDVRQGQPGQSAGGGGKGGKKGEGKSVRSPLAGVFLVYGNAHGRGGTNGALARLGEGATVVVLPTASASSGVGHTGASQGGAKGSGVVPSNGAGRTVSAANVGVGQVFTRAQLVSQHASRDECRAAGGLDISFIIQYFRRPSNIPGIVRRLSRVASSHHRIEVLVNNDSGDNVETWLRELQRARVDHWLVVADNLHEIRGYNRLGRMASSPIIVFMQDDDLPPNDPKWMDPFLKLMAGNVRLALLGGFTGTQQGGPFTGKYGKGRSKIPHAKELGMRLLYTTFLNMGPFIARRNTFLQLGGFNLNFSCPGEPGIGFDYEYTMRCWYHGYLAAVVDPGFTYHVGDWARSGTRSSRAAYQRRSVIETRNTRLIRAMYAGFYVKQGDQAKPLQGMEPRDSLRGVNVMVTVANDEIHPDWKY